MDTSAITKAFNAMELMAEAAQNAMYDLSQNESMIQKSKEGCSTARALWGTNYIDLDDLTEREKEWLQDYGNYCYAELPYRLRQFIGEAMTYYLGKPERSKDTERLRDEVEETRRNYREKQQELATLRKANDEQQAIILNLKATLDEHTKI